ncbi:MULTISPECIES: hypothetical protein [Haloferax]|nr:MULTISPECIES: hypothetical protein [Haloferax]
MDKWLSTFGGLSAVTTAVYDETAPPLSAINELVAKRAYRDERG